MTRATVSRSKTINIAIPINTNLAIFTFFVLVSVKGGLLRDLELNGELRIGVLVGAPIRSFQTGPLPHALRCLRFCRVIGAGFAG